MTNRLNFTQEVLKALPPAPPGKRAYRNDTRVLGMQPQVTDKGVMTFYVCRRVHSRPTRIKLGRFPGMEPAKTRDQAKITIGRLAAVQNPETLELRQSAERITLSWSSRTIMWARSSRPQGLRSPRATFATAAECPDSSTYAVKRLVNHKMRQDGTAGHIVTDVQRLRAPMQKICDYLLKAGSIKEGKVISMSTGGPARA